MMPKKLLLLYCCFIVCFFVSCKSVPEENQNQSGVIVPDEPPEDSTLIDDEATELETTQLSAKPEEERIVSLFALKKRFRKKASFFVVKTNRDTVIRCKEGTLLAIPAGAFLNALTQKPVLGEVRISVKEFYKLSDMIAQGLTTTSNGKILETGGMINIKVTNKEKDSCVLKPGKNISIAMANPDSNEVYGMQMFNGVHGDVQGDTNLNWVPRPGVAGLAQSWGFRRRNIPERVFPLSSAFVFPNVTPGKKPVLINSNPEDLKVEGSMSLRDLMRHVGTVTEKGNAYVDTAGDLHVYMLGGMRRYFRFKKLYSQSTSEDMKVNVTVDVAISYRSHLNHDYYQKLFKMAKGDPDSLVPITFTLNPNIKLTNSERFRMSHHEAMTVKEYQKKKKIHDAQVAEYEKKLEQLRLNSENNLLTQGPDAGTNLRNAQSYFLMSTSRLGWINCDRFYDAPEKVDYLVKLNEKASVLIVFNSIKSIMGCNASGVVTGVPLNAGITIVGLKTEGGKLMMACHKTTVTREPFEKLHFEQVTVKEYKSRLDKLNRM